MRSIRTSVRERVTSRARLSNGRVRVTKPARKLSADEIRTHEQRLRREGKI
jgi:hypothetical protein